MANTSAPKGFVPKRTLHGGAWKGLVKTYYIPSSDGTAVYVGDVVKFNGESGAAGLTINGMDMEGIPQVIRVAAGNVTTGVAGVVVGFYPNMDSLMTKHRAASTNRAVMVCPVADVIFEIQEDAVTTPVAAASVNLNASFTTTAGNATTGVSAMALDSDSVGTTGTLPLRVLGLSKRVGNAFNTAGAGSDPATFDVMFTASHQQGQVPDGI